MSSTPISPNLNRKSLEELQELHQKLLHLRDAKLQQEQDQYSTRIYFPTARPKQLPPDHPDHHLPDKNGYKCGCGGGDQQWLIWLFCGGRGTGKSATGSQWVIHQALTTPNSEWAIMAPTFRDTRKVCIEGSTGILAALNPGELVQYRRNELQLLLANGSVIYGYSGDQPDRIRGANLWGAWVDELSSFRYPEVWHEGLMPALRKGTWPRVLVTTTPKPTALIKELVLRDDGSVHLTKGSTWENAENLSAAALTELRAQYEGTRLGRQELEGELLLDLDGALWKREDIDRARLKHDQVPDLTRVVVALDPAMTSSKDSDESGIIVAGESRGEAYVLADFSMKGTPLTVMRRVVGAYREFAADAVVFEINQGYDYLRQVLAGVDPDVPYRKVAATRGKLLRAEPVASLYEQHRIHHIGVFPELEDQMVSWIPDTGRSPDRVDALVYAIADLKGLTGGSWLEAQGIISCRHCQFSFVSRLHERWCPRCGRQREEEDLISEPSPSVDGWSVLTAKR